MRQLILELLPEPPPRLDNFVAGSNGETLTGLAAWLGPDSRETSLFICGEVGSGKSHLLHACVALGDLTRGADDPAPIYHDAKTDPDLESLATDDQRANAPLPALLAIDNVDDLSDAGQITLFNCFNRQRAAGGRLLTAGSQAPRHLILREDLRTRLGSGLVYRLLTLSDGEKVAALSTQARACGLSLPGEALNYLLAHAPRDMRSLSAFLAALDRYSLEHKRPITMPLLRDVLLSAPATHLTSSH